MSLALGVLIFISFMEFSPNHIQAYYNKTQPVLNNGNFEKPNNNKDTQVYKAERVNSRQGKVYSGNYALKIEKVSPGKESKDYPRWLYNEGKGSANVVIRNVQPNTKYTVSMNYFNETGVKFRLGVLDIEGNKEWKPGQINSNYQTFNQKPINGNPHHMKSSLVQGQLKSMHLL